MASGLDENQKYVLFEFLDALSITFRRSDMEYPDIRRQLLELLRCLLGFQITPEAWARELACVPEDWGDFLGFRITVRGKRVTASVFRADREPGVNSGENAVITAVETIARH